MSSGNSSTSILFSLHFWSGREELLIRETDFGTFRFHDKQEQKEIVEGQRRQYGQDKLSYSQLRGHQPSLDPKQRGGGGGGGGGGKQNKQALRSGLRELEILLAEQTVVFGRWRSSALYQCMLSSGVVVSVRLIKSGDIERIIFDKFLVGRVLDFITDVQFSAKLIVIAYLESRVTVLHLGKEINFSTYESLEKHDPKIYWLDLMGPPGRRLPRKVLVSSNDHFCLVWWSSSDHEVFPWTPNLLEEDRANVMLFSLRSPSEPRRVAYLRTLSDPLALRFVSSSSSSSSSELQTPLSSSSSSLCTVHYLGQDTTSRKGEIHLENTYLVAVEGDRQLRRKNPQRLALAAHVTCSEFVGNLVILGCADGTLMVYDCLHHRLDCQTKPLFIPNLIRVHPDKTIFMAASEKGVVQCFDIALTHLRLQFSHDDQLSSPVLDLGQYFKVQMSLVEADFCSRVKDVTGIDSCAMSSNARNYLLLRFHGGPFVLAIINGGVYNSGALGPIQITAQYLKHQQYHQVLLLLNELEWSQHGPTIVTCVNTTFNKLIRLPFCREIEVLMELCLGLFYAPNKPIEEEVLDEYSEQIHDLSRKFFHHLLRHNQVVKSFQLAVDINDYDLFMDLYHAASRMQLTDLAEASLVKARSVFQHVTSSGEDLSAPPTAEGGDTEGDEDEDDDSEDEDSLPPPPPTPPPIPQPQTKQGQAPLYSRPAGLRGNFPMLPSPMQIFSSVTMVQVEHPPPPPQDAQQQQQEAAAEPVLRASMQPHISATYAHTTAAKRIATNEFKSAKNTSDGNEEPIIVKYDSIASLPRLNVNLEDAEDIKVIHFGLV